MHVYMGDKLDGLGNGVEMSLGQNRKKKIS